MDQQQGQGGGGGGQDQMAQFKEMAIQVNEGIGQIGQALGQMSPEAGSDMADLQKQYQGIVQSALSGEGGEKGRQAPQERPAEAGAAQVRPSY